MEEPQAASLASRLFRNLWILAILTVVFLVVLAAAPMKWHISEWRDIQREYNRRAEAAGLPPMTVALQQIWRPEIGLTDRCGTCHVGMAAAKPLDGGADEKLYGRHPEVNHVVSRMGCTICHQGQGRATTSVAAHGNVKHWESPMLPAAHLQASCGGCHGDAARIPPMDQVERGAYLFMLHGCNACHRVDGLGGNVGPDLSGVALKGFDREWHIRHLREPASVVEGSSMMSFGHLDDREIDDLLAYLDTLIGAPDLIRGKAIAVQLGCRGCHKIGGLGGEESVDLNEAASKPATDYDFTHVAGSHTRENWHREHLRNPQRVAPGSKMPPYILPQEREDALVTYVLSLRRPDVGMDHLPRETLLAHLEQRRDFSQDGEALFGVFCASCHGGDGTGQVVPALGTTVPNVKNPDVHAVMSVESLRYIVRHGRPGRSMPAWSDAGLSEAELEAVVDFLREGLPQPPDFESVRAATGDRALGRKVFLNDCSACHGPEGEGTVIAPGLSNPEFQCVADDEYLSATLTRGRAGTAMPAHPQYDAETVAGLIAWVRELGSRSIPRPDALRQRMQRTIVAVLRVRELRDYRALGSPAYGAILYDSMCVGCHGKDGRGLVGPAVGSPAFLRTASDGFIAGTVLLGRGGRPMRSFGPHGLAKLEGREIGDLIAYLRQAATRPPATPGYRTVQGTASQGDQLFGRYCAGCHGAEGEGRIAPALRNPAFLASVSDGFLQATLVRGRSGTAMRSWARGGYGFGELAPEEINDIVAFVRGWQDGN